MPEVVILRGTDQQRVTVAPGANLRRVLLDAGFTPYTAVTRVANCGGRGLCATCGVWIETGEPQPVHWHDRIGNRFGYPRLSCQITVEDDMIVRIIADKWIWGRRRASKDHDE